MQENSVSCTDNSGSQLICFKSFLFCMMNGICVCGIHMCVCNMYARICVSTYAVLGLYISLCLLNSCLETRGQCMFTATLAWFGTKWHLGGSVSME